MNGKLRGYQQEGVDIMRQRKSFLEYDDMGLGKTLTTLFTCTEIGPLLKEKGHGLIVCPTNALAVWEAELIKWFNLPSMIYAGTKKQREKIWQNYVDLDIPYIITTYGMVKDLPDNFDVMICDEIHQGGLLNHKNVTYGIIEKKSRHIPYLFLLTGTPIRQGVIDTYGPLHLIDPVRFNNYWSFVNRWCVQTQGPFGKVIERNPKDVEAFRAMMKEYMVRRLKTEVLKELPGKQRNPIPLIMTPLQEKAHHDVTTDLLYYDADTTVVAPNQMTAQLRARQILVTPRLVGIDEDGASLDYLSEVGSDLLCAGRPYVVFTTFREAIPYIEEVVKRAGDVHVYIITGGMKPCDFAYAWQGFQKDPSKRKVLIMTIKSAASFEAYEAADCFFLGFEWDFNFNAQAEDRLCRPGQLNFVNCNYLLHKGDSVDRQVTARLNAKNEAAMWIAGTETQYNQLLAERDQPKETK